MARTMQIPAAQSDAELPGLAFLVAGAAPTLAVPDFVRGLNANLIAEKQVKTIAVKV